MANIEEEIKVHETLIKKDFTQPKRTWTVHVVNLTNIPLEADVIYDIDEFKILISKKKKE